MQRQLLLMAGLLACAGAAAEAPPPEPEFLEFLAETAGEDEDEGFNDYLLSRDFDRDIGRVRTQRTAAKEGKDER